MRVCVITATRAEYGLLYPLLCEIKKDDSMQLDLVVSGTHLLEKFGNTVQEIISDGFEYIYKIPIIEEERGTNEGTSVIMASVMTKSAPYFKKRKPDIAVILGDRFEMMAFAIALVNEKIPIAHLNGGEITGGSLDEIYRHCITKMSTLHFTNCEEHKRNVIQLGEPPQNVYNVGDLCVDNILNTELLDINKLENLVGVKLKNKKILIVTFHPATMESNSIEILKNMLHVIERNSEFFYIFTGANVDSEGARINSIINEFVSNHDNTLFVLSLGRVGYLSALRFSCGVIGNSSSGLYEAPYFNIPTINIGKRQQNRLHGETVLDCGGNVDDIQRAFEYAFGDVFSEKCCSSTNIWGDGKAASRIKEIIKMRVNEGIDIKKSFYQAKFEADM